MTALETLQPRIGKLFLMLSSDRDGEIVAAAHALGRVLRDNGTDWHALADAIVFRSDNRSNNNAPMPWRDMARICRASGRLSDRELAFVTDMENWRAQPSAKQAAWLHTIYNRVRR